MAEYLDVLRTEKKYILSVEKAHRIMAHLSWLMKPDDNCADGEPYLVKSLYFDSVYDQDYYEKCSGLLYRKKLRLRSYGGGSIIKLEWKKKQGAKQRKLSLPVSIQEARELMAGDYSCLAAQDMKLAGQFYGLMTEKVYRPKCLVQYKRFAYAEPTNDIRITFDSQISAREGCFGLLEDNTPVYPVQQPGTVVLEIKYNHFLLDPIQTALAPFGLVESANSKYVKSRYYGFGGNK